MKKVLMATMAATCVVSAADAFAGGELAYGSYQYPAPQQQYYSTYPSAAYQQVNYARPASAYYGQAAPCGSPCGGGYARGGGMFGMNNDILTAGLVGVGIGYLIFH